MARFRLMVAYDGEGFHGWQIQPTVRTVEGELTRAAERLLGVGKGEVKVQGASRTDAGVHAYGQVAHLTFTQERSAWDLVRGLNGLTDDDVTVVRAERVEDAFHARHEARGKIYHYRLWAHRFVNPHARRRAWHVRARLDVARMRRAAALLVGEHDFAAFRASDCEAKTTVRHIWRVDVHEEGEGLRIEVEGSAFLKYMVRIITGTLVDVGRGHLEVEDVARALETGRREDTGQTAPPHGLTLVKVHYPDWPWGEPEPRLGGAWLAE